MTKGERIKELRQTLGLTLEEFGSKLGVTRSSISHIEKGTRQLTKQLSTAIVRAYNVNPECLEHGTGAIFIESDKELEKALNNIDEKGKAMIKELVISFARLPRTTQNEVVENTIKLCELLLKSVK